MSTDAIDRGEPEAAALYIGPGMRVQLSLIGGGPGAEEIAKRIEAWNFSDDDGILTEIQGFTFLQDGSAIWGLVGNVSLVQVVVASLPTSR